MVVQALGEYIDEKAAEGSVVIDTIGPDCFRLLEIHDEIDTCLLFLRQINLHLTKEAGLLQ